MCLSNLALHAALKALESYFFFFKLNNILVAHYYFMCLPHLVILTLFTCLPNISDLSIWRPFEVFPPVCQPRGAQLCGAGRQPGLHEVDGRSRLGRLTRADLGLGCGEQDRGDQNGSDDTV